MDARGKGKWIGRNQAQWRSLLSRFCDSGLSVSVFCRREGVSTASFDRWRDLIERHDGGKDLTVGNEPVFVDLGTLRGESVRGAAPVEFKLDLGGGLSLHLVRR